MIYTSGDPGPAAAHRPRRVLRWLLPLLAVILVAAGIVLIVGSHRTVYDPAPLPSRTWSVASPSPAGPSTARVHPDGRDADAAVRGDRTDDRVTMAPASMGPDRVFIPSLGVYARVGDVSIIDGNLEIPGNPLRLGRWVGGGPLAGGSAGSHGETLVVGHVSEGGVDGALHHLAYLRPGARVWTTDGSGHRSAWIVASMRTEPRFSGHTDLFTPAGQRRLVLATCGGAVEHGHYQRTVVVTAVPA
jgi:hypothetical protein